MNEYEVSGELNGIDFGATGVKEILQNVRMILTTPVFSCPMNRDFAYIPNLDGPIHLVQAQLTAQIVEAIRQFEPRAEVVRITFQADGMEGRLKPIVRVRVADGAV